MTEIKFELDSFGEFDETWFANTNVHIERMDETAFWIGFDLPDGQHVRLNTGVHRGVWYFNLEEDRVGGGNHVSVQRPRNSRRIAATKPAPNTAQSLPVEAPEFLKGSEDQEGKL